MLAILPDQTQSVSLRRQFPNASFVDCADIYVSEVSDHSHRCKPNLLFAAIPGTQVNGHDYVHEAISRGASCLLVESPLANVSVPQCVVSNVRKAYAELCTAFVDYPSRDLNLVGVTGTNGKTTICWLLRSIFQQTKKQAGLLGTIEYSDGIKTSKSTLTTPDSATFTHWLKSMVDVGTTFAAVELSSHALDQHRIAGTELDVAIVTNVTHDHLDYHENAEAYRKSKLQILNYGKPHAHLVLNLDDPGSRSFQAEAQNWDIIHYGFTAAADVTAQIIQASHSGTRFELQYGRSRVEIQTTLIGQHNVSNCLAAAAAALQLGCSLDQIAEGIESVQLIPGRLERIPNEQPFQVFVDYAHTPDALKKSIQTLKSLTKGRVLCLFGAGGDRDRSKRHLLGREGAKADLLVITNDNPRTESPTQIISDVLLGVPETKSQIKIELDREQAIRWALQHAQPGDCVLIAGKGHESEQIIGTDHLKFDDRTFARRILVEQQSSRPSFFKKGA